MRFVFSVLAALASFALPADAARITFDDIDLGGADHVRAISFASGAFAFAGTNNETMVYGAATVCAGGCTYNGTQSLRIYNGYDSAYAGIVPHSVVMTRTDGAAFDLVSLDMTGFFAGFDEDPTYQMALTGAQSSGPDVTQSFAVPSGGAFTTILTPGFTSVTSVTFQSNVYSVALDDIVVAQVGAVPLPATGLMLIAPLMIGGWAARRR